MTTATFDLANTTARPDVATTEQAQPEPHSFGHFMKKTVPASILLLFVITTVGIHTQTLDWATAIEFGVYAAVWVGGGFGFMIGGVMWGLEQVEH